MRGLGLGLVLWALGATLASAAVVRIDVTGSAIGTVRGDLVNAQRIIWSMSVGTAASNPSNVPQLIDRGFNALDYVRSTSGSMLLDEGRPISCVGLLLPVCASSIPVSWDDAADTFGVSVSLDGGGGGVVANQGGLYSANDAIRTIMLEGARFTGGPTVLELRATFTSATVSVVPLPASASLVLAGLGALVLLRRGRGLARPEG